MSAPVFNLPVAAGIATEAGLENQVNAGFTALYNQTVAETNARVAADTALQGGIDSEASTRASAISAEASARAAADTALQGQINTETAARVAAISAEASTRASAISAEASARAAADTALQGQINTETAARVAAISAEASTRASADTALQGGIDAEVANRSAIIRTDGAEDGAVALMNALRRVFAEFGADGSIFSRYLRVAPDGSVSLGSLSLTPSGDLELPGVLVSALGDIISSYLRAENDGSGALGIFGPYRRVILYADQDGIDVGPWIFMDGDKLKLGPMTVTDAGISGPGLDGGAALAALATRVGRSLDAAGNLTNGPVLSDQLARLQGKLLRLAGGETGVAAKLGLFGDSWVFRDNSTPKVRAYLQARFGSGGPGYLRLHANADPVGNPQVVEVTPAASVSLTGTGWVSNQTGDTAPSLSAGRSTTSTAGDGFTASGSDAARFNAARLLYVAGGAGEYRWNSGSWTSLDMSTGNVIAMDAGRPSSGAWTLEWRNVSGTTTLVGLSLDGPTGAIVDRGGTSGMRADWLATITADAVFQAQFAARAYDAVTITLGTNDQRQYLPSVFAGHLGAIIDNLRISNPLLGIALVMPCENKRTTVNLAPMDAYWEAARDLARTKRVAVHSMQAGFGADPAVYGAIWPDDIHTDATEGGGIMAATTLRAIMGDI